MILSPKILPADNKNQSMKKRLLFSVQYTALCIFLTFLLITVFGKHYQLDARLIVPCLAALPGAFFSGWLFFVHKKRFWHLRIGLFALLFTFVFSWTGFLFVRLSAPGSVFRVSLLKALFDARNKKISVFEFMTK